MSTTCAVPGCTGPCSQVDLMCRLHWHQVPLTLRKAVKVAWTNVQGRLRVADTRQCDSRIAHNREIRQRAVDSIAKRSGAQA